MYNQVNYTGSGEPLVYETLQSLTFVVHNKGVIKNGQSRKTGNIHFCRAHKTKKNNTICVGHK
jgi:hypothetical protein